MTAVSIRKLSIMNAILTLVLLALAVLLLQSCSVHAAPVLVDATAGVSVGSVGYAYAVAFF